jgi:hypothetical protein
MNNFIISLYSAQVNNKKIKIKKVNDVVDIHKINKNIPIIHKKKRKGLIIHKEKFKSIRKINSKILYISLIGILILSLIILFYPLIRLLTYYKTGKLNDKQINIWDIVIGEANKERIPLKFKLISLKIYFSCPLFYEKFVKEAMEYFGLCTQITTEYFQKRNNDMCDNEAANITLTPKVLKNHTYNKAKREFFYKVFEGHLAQKNAAYTYLNTNLDEVYMQRATLNKLKEAKTDALKDASKSQKEIDKHYNFLKKWLNLEIEEAMYFFGFSLYYKLTDLNKSKAQAIKENKDKIHIELYYKILYNHLYEKGSLVTEFQFFFKLNDNYNYKDLIKVKEDALKKEDLTSEEIKYINLGYNVLKENLKSISNSYRFFGIHNSPINIIKLKEDNEIKKYMMSDQSNSDKILADWHYNNLKKQWKKDNKGREEVMRASNYFSHYFDLFEYLTLEELDHMKNELDKNPNRNKIHTQKYYNILKLYYAAEYNKVLNFFN